MFCFHLSDFRIGNVSPCDDLLMTWCELRHLSLIVVDTRVHLLTEEVCRAFRRIWYPDEVLANRPCSSRLVHILFDVLFFWVLQQLLMCCLLLLPSVDSALRWFRLNTIWQLTDDCFVFQGDGQVATSSLNVSAWTLFSCRTEQFCRLHVYWLSAMF